MVGSDIIKEAKDGFITRSFNDVCDCLYCGLVSSQTLVDKFEIAKRAVCARKDFRIGETRRS